MQPMQIFIQEYGLTHTELSQLTGKHRTNISKMAGNARLIDNQMLSICWKILLKVRSMPAPACIFSTDAHALVTSEWIEQEKLKQAIWQQKLTRLLSKLEKVQQQAAFWELLCHCQQELVCTSEWLNRHKEEKRALLQKCWEHEYLPLLLKLRQCDARMAALMQDKTHSFYPPGNITSNTVLTITHYDDYSKLGNYTGHGLTVTVETVDGFSGENNTVYPYARALPVSPGPTRGMSTITRTRIVGTTNFITSLTIYDADGRAIQAKTYNPEGQVTDIATTQYGFAGQVMRTLYRQRVAQTTPQTLITVTESEFDGIGRPSKTQKRQGHVYGASLTPALSTAKTIAQVKYDALGQVRDKLIGTKPGTGNPLETLKYDYNIRGWLLGVNRAFVTTANTGGPVAGKWFGFDLGYDKTANASGKGYDAVQHNGNISGQSWRSAGDNVARQYQYTYDAANRLMKANFEQNQGSGWAKSFNYDSWMGDGITASSAYDLNGNIKKMQQWGWTATSPLTQIDNLTYIYVLGTNKLRAINDLISPLPGLGDFTNKHTGIWDYGYDNNGNMITDMNKRLSGTTGINLQTGGAISYNHLNLPTNINVKKDDGSAKGSINYTYDANATKLRKVVTEPGATVNGTTTTITTTTFYLGSMVYETKAYSNSTLQTALGYSYQLQFFGHEEGRVRAVRATPQSNLTALVYDYMLKDHLGNVRMVLTEETQTNIYPAATFEGEIWDLGANSMVNHEKNFFAISDLNKIVNEDNVPGFHSATGSNYENNNGNPPTNVNYPAGCVPNQTTGSRRLYRLNATANKTDLQFMLKVMAGDKIDIFGKSYHNNTTNVTNGNSSALDILSIITSMLGSPGNAIAAKGITPAQMNTWNSGLIPTTFIRGNNNEATTQVPKAYINYLFFDEQFKFVSGNFSRVGNSGMVKSHWTNDAQLQDIAVPKNGYIFVYVSNESNFDVFFDNLQVIHKPGALLEETHYYPFGLTMAGISSKAAGKLENRKKFNGGTEFTTDLDLNIYETSWRSYDPQLGRFHQIDMLAHTTPDYSPYAFVQNNPILFFDPLGLDTVRVNGEGSHKIKIRQGDVLAWTNGDETSYYSYDPDNENAVGGFVGEGIDASNLPGVTVAAPSKPKQTTDYSSLASWQLAAGYAGIGLDSYMKGVWKGPYTYRTSAGVAQTVFDTKYGQGKSPKNLGNINNYSKNAQRAIRTTKYLRGASSTLIVAGLVMDWGQVAYAVATDDPNKNIFIMKSSLNSTIAAYGVLVPGVGWVIAGGYFLGDALLPGGWGGAMEAGYQNTLRNREIIPNWNPRPGGGLGN